MNGLMNPRVSVVIPTYNRAVGVQKAIESVLAQTITNFEVIVVDDGSSDDTGKVLREVFGDRIRYYVQTNQGASVARNTGIDQALGEWIAFLDSDDLWEKDKLERQLKALERFGPQCGGCYTDTRFFNNPETRTMFQMAEESYRHEGTMGVNAEALRLLVRPGGAGMVICLSSFMVRADIARKAGGFDPVLLYSQDSDFMFRLAMLDGILLRQPPAGLVRPVARGNSPCGSERGLEQAGIPLQDSQLRLEGLLRVSNRLPPSVRGVIREQLSLVHSGWVNWHLEAGHYGEAREAVSRAVRLDLSLRIAVKWLLTWMSPQLALRTVRRHQQSRTDSIA